MSNNSKKLILPGSLQRATKSNFQCSSSHTPLAKEKQQPGQQECAFHKEKGERLDWPWGSSCLFHSYPQNFAFQLWAGSLPGNHRNVKEAAGQQRGYTPANTASARLCCCLTFPYFSVRGTDPQCSRSLSAAWQSCHPPATLNNLVNSTAWEPARSDLWNCGSEAHWGPFCPGGWSAGQKLPLRHCLQCLELCFHLFFSMFRNARESYTKDSPRKKKKNIWFLFFVKPGFCL